MFDRTLFLHLSLIKGVGPSLIHALFEKITEQDKKIDLYKMSASDLVHSFSLTLKQATLISNGLKNRLLLEKELSLIEEYNVCWATCFDDSYPELLKQIHRPPLVIYWQGTSVWQTKSNGVAFVGSRKATASARHFLDTTIAKLVVHDVYTVSGGAIGADTMAHQATLNAGGKTIAVLGSGLLYPYPASNKQLFKKIVTSGGAVLSTFSLATSPSAGNFPARNYIISGLSKATVVVQAAQKSGALITAYAALEQGREVCAVPGLFNDPLVEGCHHLIRQGAQLTTNVDDIISLLGEIQTICQEPIKQIKIEVSNSGRSQKRTEINLPTDEQEVYLACVQPVSIDEIIRQVGLDYAKVSEILFDLSLDGKVEQEASGLWRQV